MKNRIDLFSGCGFILIALLIMFVIPVDSLQHSGGRARLGAVFFALHAWFGEYTARYFFALPWALFGYHLLRERSQGD
ncbi:MAG: hypothetical protein PHI11_06015 [Gallionella sp.]|nr:hypothetical protein [Gallionella sp.]